MMKRLLILLFLFCPALRAQCTGGSPTWSLTFANTSSDNTNFQNCINGATSGDTIQTTGSTSTLTSISLSGKYIVWKGQGSTSVNFGVTGSSNIISFTATTTGSMQITGVTFTGSRINGGCPIVMNTTLSPLTTAFRIWNNTFSDGSPSNPGTIICTGGQGPGLIDHNTFNAATGADELIHNNGLGNSSGPTGFTTDITPGGANCIFMENNQFNNNANFGTQQAEEAFNGACIVFRHNNMLRFQMDVHAGNPTGGRWFETYENNYNVTSTVSSQVQANYWNHRGGSGVVFNNHVTGTVCCSDPLPGAPFGPLNGSSDPQTGAYPLNYQLGRGINNTYSPVYIWGNDTNVQSRVGVATLASGNVYVRMGGSPTDSACTSNSNTGHPANVCDAVLTTSQPSTLLRCESAADVSAGCPVSYSYTPYTYAHPLDTLPTSCYGQGCSSSDRFYANTAQGGNNGSDCADAWAWNDGTNGWGLSVSQQPGITIHVCGTITGTANQTILTAINDGTSSGVITVAFESGAILQSPYWQGSGTTPTGGINLAKNYWVVDGASTGTIQNTANGTGLTYQADSCAIGGAGSNLVVKNLTIANIYVHTGLGVDGANTFGTCFSGGSNITVSYNTAHDARWMLHQGLPGGQTTSNIVFTGNIIYQMDHGITIGDNNSGAHLSGALIYGNVFHDMTNWDNTLDNFHHDYIHHFLQNGGGATSTGVQIYGNYFYGDVGANCNSLIFIEQGASTTITGIAVFNNVLTMIGTTRTPPYGALNIGAGSAVIVNNTVIGGIRATTNGVNACVHFAGPSYTFENNLCQVLGDLDVVGNSTTTLSKIDYNSYYQWSNVGSQGYSPYTNYNTLATWASACAATWSVGSAACDAHSITANPNIATSAPWTPNTGSPVIAAGVNLASLCSSYPALCNDFNGVSRSPTGAWDIGAATSSTGTSRPLAPTSLSGVVH